MSSETRGARYERWLHDPTDTSCPIELATLTLEDMVADGAWVIEQVSDIKDRNWRRLEENGLIFLRHDHQEIASAFGLSSDKVYRHIRLHSDTSSLFNWSVNEYDFITGPGCIFALNSKRVNGPHWSEIALAVYRYFQREKLEYVFRVNVINEETNQVIRNSLYTSQNGLSWPDCLLRVWVHGTPEFTAVLGTPNVQGVAALILGEYPRGTKTIREIYTWASPVSMWLQMAVRIADFEQPAVEQLIEGPGTQPGN